MAAKAWDSTTSFLIRLPTGAKLKIVISAFNCDDSMIVAISTNSTFSWNIEAKTYIVLEIVSYSRTVHPFMRGFAFVGTPSGRASLWDVIERKMIIPLEVDHTSRISEAIWSHSRSFVVPADSNGCFTIFRNALTMAQPVTQELFLLHDFDDSESDQRGNPTIFNSRLQPLDQIASQLSCLKINTKMPSISKRTLEIERLLMEK
jgi:hypothetical protein